MPAPLRETVSGARRRCSRDEADEINSSAIYGFVFDFCGIEIDRDTGKVCVDRMSACTMPGRILNAALSTARCAALLRWRSARPLERFIYDESAVFLPKLCLICRTKPRAGPDLLVLHRETLSPITPLGAKGVAEGNSMSTPVCIANAVADRGRRWRFGASVDAPRLLRLLAASEHRRKHENRSARHCCQIRAGETPRGAKNRSEPMASIRATRRRTESRAAGREAGAARHPNSPAAPAAAARPSAKSGGLDVFRPGRCGAQRLDITPIGRRSTSSR